ncbi:hypothetical protein RchiOBHm_Chr5g0065691 [Rosa chinensis]|uniref:Uncharacterized protein n=1 Tax=Rosa chinensis TaxID=74649 RepID=A0A2P6QJ00_ROSCH|nr:hypothetical protein RchiOBHm_Chr5g0065691 [Rosa chinensis]
MNHKSLTRKRVVGFRESTIMSSDEVAGQNGILEDSQNPRSLRVL